MNITESWIGKSAGGSIFKEARNLLRRGKIINVTRKGNLFQGQMQTSKRPMRIVVNVLGPNEIRNQCSCMMARRTGALCEHATALMLIGIKGPSFQSLCPPNSDISETNAPTSPAAQNVPGIDPVALEVCLSPQFPHEAIRSVHIRKPSSPATPTDSDIALTRWLIENAGQATPAMLSLPEKEISSFFRTLHGHQRVWRGKEKLHIRTDRLRPLVELKVNGDSVQMRLLGENLLTLGTAMAEWNGNTLVIDPSDASNASQNLHDWQSVKTKAFISMLPALAEMYHLPEDLGGLHIREATPDIQLEISGSTRALQAKLSARYSPQVCIDLAKKQNNTSHFPLASPEVPDLWIVRNREYEQQAIATLMQTGFQILDASGLLFLRGEDEVLDFLSLSLPSLREKWSVHTDTKLARIENRIERITPSIHIQSHSEDWLSCEVAWQCGNQTLSASAVRKLLMSGGRTISLPQGGKAVLSHFDSEVMDGFLLDTNPTQESGNYLIPAQQAAYLKELQAFYSKTPSSSSEKTIKTPPLPAKLKKTLRDYQHTGVNWLYQKLNTTGAALLADDMGLGKTLQALTCIHLWKKNHSAQSSAPALIVCPATLVGNWHDEATRFTPDLSVLIMHGSQRRELFGKMASADIIITSYALLDRDNERYQKLDISMIVLDEASAIRNPDTLAAKAARNIKAPARIAISGTPLENGVRDLWSIFQFLMPGYLGTRKDFRTRYELPCQAEIPDLAAMQRLRWRTAPFMLRRTKAQVANDLPPKLESIVWCDPSPLQKDHYSSIRRHGVEKIESLRRQAGPDASRMQMLTVLLRLRQSCCDLRLLDSSSINLPDDPSLAEVSSKLARLMELLDEARRGNHRVLIFSQFTSMLHLIREELDRADIDFSYLDGSTRDRSAVVKQFQKPDGPPVFLISLKAGGYGLTLTAADTVVLFDPWWNPAVEAQAADRIHRIGQTKPSTIYKLITRGTVEEKILRLQEKKRKLISAAMGEISNDTTPLMSGLTNEEMQDLLE